MLLVILMIICVIVTAVFTWIAVEDLLSTILASILALLVATALWAVLLLIGECIPGEVTYELVDSKEIFVMNDSTGTSASYYLFGGYSDSKLIYRYIYEGEFGYNVDEVDAEDSSIIFSDTPKVEKYEKHFVNPIHDLFSYHGISYRFYVPEGTITMQQYNVDLK